jgi:hypothetical protein
LIARRRKISMFLRPRCLAVRPVAPLSRSTVFPRFRSGFRNYSTSTKTSPRSVGTAPVIPPSPETLRKLRSKESRWRKSLLAGFLAATGVAYYLDGRYNARAIRRTFRTAWVGATLAIDYKWNFTYRFSTLLTYCRPEKAESIEELHKRVARRIMDLISANGGLYIKLGTRSDYHL